MKEAGAAHLTHALVIGSAAFIENMRRQLANLTGEGTNARAWRRLLPFRAIVRAVEGVKREPWNAFVNRRGDWGRDLALEIGRRHGGMTLHELGAEAGMNLHNVYCLTTTLFRQCLLSNYDPFSPLFRHYISASSNASLISGSTWRSDSRNSACAHPQNGEVPRAENSVLSRLVIGASKSLSGSRSGSKEEGRSESLAGRMLVKYAKLTQ